MTEHPTRPSAGDLERLLNIRADGPTLSALDRAIAYIESLPDKDEEAREKARRDGRCVCPDGGYRWRNVYCGRCGGRRIGVDPTMRPDKDEERGREWTINICDKGHIDKDFRGVCWACYPGGKRTWEPGEPRQTEPNTERVLVREVLTSNPDPEEGK